MSQEQPAAPLSDGELGLQPRISLYRQLIRGQQRTMLRPGMMLRDPRTGGLTTYRTLGLASAEAAWINSNPDKVFPGLTDLTGEMPTLPDMPASCTDEDYLAYVDGIKFLRENQPKWADLTLPEGEWGDRVATAIARVTAYVSSTATVPQVAFGPFGVEEY